MPVSGNVGITLAHSNVESPAIVRVARQLAHYCCRVATHVPDSAVKFVPRSASHANRDHLNLNGIILDSFMIIMHLYF